MAKSYFNIVEQISSNAKSIKFKVTGAEVGIVEESNKRIPKDFTKLYQYMLASLPSLVDFNEKNKQLVKFTDSVPQVGRVYFCSTNMDNITVQYKTTINQVTDGASDARTLNNSLYFFTYDQLINFIYAYYLMDNRKLINMMLSFEGFVDHIYDAQPQIPEVYDATIGYGHKLTQEELKNGTYSNGITRDAAKELFTKDFNNHAEPVVHFMVNHGIILTHYQFDAMVSLTYNIGTNYWEVREGHETTQDFILNQDFSDAAVDAFYQVWEGKKAQAQGLVPRREKEKVLFKTGIYLDVDGNEIK